MAGDGLVLRDATPGDAAAVAAIHTHWVLTSTISFEEEAVPAAAMGERMRDVTSAGLPWLVASERGRVVGYAYATAWKHRAAYRRSVETTVYLEPGAVGRGVGRALYEALLARLRERGAHAVLAGIALPNAASVALHERLGYEKVAHLREVGFESGRWIDVGYRETILDSPAG